MCQARRIPSKEDRQLCLGMFVLLCCTVGLTQDASDRNFVRIDFAGPLGGKLTRSSRGRLTLVARFASRLGHRNLLVTAPSGHDGHLRRNATLPSSGGKGHDAPDGFDGAVQGGMWIGSGHCYRSHQLQPVDASAAICWRSDSAAQPVSLLCAGSALRTGWVRSLPSQRPGEFRLRSRRRGCSWGHA